MIVLNPKSTSDNAFKDWDLWGPMFFTLFLSVILALTGESSETSILFTGIFTICSFGGAVITINFILLGGTMGFFPTLCALGYCLFPSCISSLVCAVLNFTIIKLIVCGIALYWSIISIQKFFKSQIPENRVFLGLYPCILFYAIISWIIFIH